MTRGEVWWYEHPESARRPFLILTRPEAVPVLDQVLGVQATRSRRGIPTEVALDTSDGMPSECVLTLDNTQLIRKSLCVEKITTLSDERMRAVCQALHIAAGC